MTLYYLGPCLTCMVKGNKHHYQSITPEKGMLFQRLNAKKINADAAAV